MSRIQEALQRAGANGGQTSEDHAQLTSPPFALEGSMEREHPYAAETPEREQRQVTAVAPAVTPAAPATVAETDSGGRRTVLESIHEGVAEKVVLDDRMPPG